MNYELAKKLKDAGFPGSDKWKECSGSFGKTFRDYDGYGVPTLSELIEACGDRFEELTRIGHGIAPKFRAVAYSCEQCEVGMEVGSGDTAKEAVAKLWLEINKK